MIDYLDIFTLLPMETLAFDTDFLLVFCLYIQLPQVVISKSPKREIC